MQKYIIKLFRMKPIFETSHKLFRNWGVERHMTALTTSQFHEIKGYIIYRMSIYPVEMLSTTKFVV